jgi:hypothetical protein
MQAGLDHKGKAGQLGYELFWCAQKMQTTEHNHDDDIEGES